MVIFRTAENARADGVLHETVDVMYTPSFGLSVLVTLAILLYNHIVAAVGD